MELITQTPAIGADTELDRLARLYATAGGPGMRVLGMLGTRAESLLDRLPGPVRVQLGAATEQALHAAMRAADGSRATIPEQAPWVQRAVTTAMGAAGGMGGLPTALVELPVTTAVLLRSIQGAASRHGFDPAAESVKFDCVRVFSAAGPLAHDDGADTGFLALRLTLTGTAMNKLIAAVAPRLGLVLGQKLAAQSVPVLGALAGAATNYAYTSYYQSMADVHFGMRRLAIETDRSEAELLDDLRGRMALQAS